MYMYQEEFVITLQHKHAKTQHIGWIWTSGPKCRGLKNEFGKQDKTKRVFQ